MQSILCCKGLVTSTNPLNIRLYNYCHQLLLLVFREVDKIFKLSWLCTTDADFWATDADYLG